MSTSRRKHGLEPPYNPLQVATWVLYPVLIVFYFAFLFPLLWTHTAVLVVVTLVFTASAIFGAMTGYQCCVTDPVDDSLVSRHKPSAAVSRTDEEAESEVFCYLCEVNVDATSKHCRICDKCVRGFDHHCKWLNTCIGAKVMAMCTLPSIVAPLPLTSHLLLLLCVTAVVVKNYPMFCWTVGLIATMTTTLLVLCVALLVDMLVNPGPFNVRRYTMPPPLQGTSKGPIHT